MLNPPAIWNIISHMNLIGLTRKDEMQGKNEQASGVYKEVNEHCERVFNTADRFSRKPNTKRKFLVAYSGGLDSHVLLHLLAQLREKQNIQLCAVHVNHQLSPNAKKWQEHCQKICDQLGIPLISQRINLKNISSNIEEAARNARYEVFKNILQEDECLLLAHQQDDQAETLLLQLLRGAGPRGLAAMPRAIEFGLGQLLRPLLNFTRSQILTYAKENNLIWIEDETNAEIHFSRNFLRAKIFPVLQSKWPSVNQIFARAALQCAEASELLDDLARLDLGIVQYKPSILLIDKLQHLKFSRQRNVLRLWLRNLQFPTPSSIKISQIQNEVIAAAPDAMPLVKWENIEIRRYQNHLYALKAAAQHDPNRIIPWDGLQPLVLPDHLGALEAKDFKVLFEKHRDITVRFRQGGERCKPMGRSGSHPLKKLFQEWHVPPWQRDRIPLIYCGESLIAVAGYCICETSCH